MDDLVVIILTLLIVVVGILGQIKKKKQIPVVTEGDETPGNIWDLIQNEINEPAKAPEIKYVEDEPVVPEEQVEPKFYQFEAQNEGVPFVQKESEESQLKKAEKGDKEKFSLRKAVIYSEILNRKYI